MPVNLVAHVLERRLRSKRCRDKKEISLRRGQINSRQRHAGQLLQAFVAKELHVQPLSGDEQSGVIGMIQGANRPGEHQMAGVEVPRHVAVSRMRFDRPGGLGVGLDRAEFFFERRQQFRGFDPADRANNDVRQHDQPFVPIFLNFGQCCFKNVPLHRGMVLVVSITLRPPGDCEFVRARHTAVPG